MLALQRTLDITQIKKVNSRSSLVAWQLSLLWHGFGLAPELQHAVGETKKKKKERKKESKFQRWGYGVPKCHTESKITESPSHSNQTSKRNKRYPNWKKRGEFVTKADDMTLYIENPKDSR